MCTFRCHASSKCNLLWSDHSSSFTSIALVLPFIKPPHDSFNYRKHSSWFITLSMLNFSEFRCISSSSSITPLPLKSAYFNIFTFTWIRFFYFLRTYPIWIFTCKQVLLSSCPHYWLEGQLSPNGTLIYSQVRTWQKCWCSVSEHSNFQQKITLFRKSSLST